MKIYCPDKSIVTNLNINSTRNRFNSLSFIIEKDVDMLLISENKLRDSFVSRQFKTWSYIKEAICKSWNWESGNGMKGMREMGREIGNWLTTTIKYRRVHISF